MPAEIREALEGFIANLQQEGIDRDEVRVLLGSFLESGAVLIDDLQAAIRNQDGPLLSLTAHTLKGSSATFGLGSLANLSAALERAGNQQHWDGAGETLAETLAAYQEAREVVAGMIRVPEK
jgi:HPt (histidine-containing phosphotransfer) domain-containing protein